MVKHLHSRHETLSLITSKERKKGRKKRTSQGRREGENLLKIKILFMYNKVTSMSSFNVYVPLSIHTVANGGC